MGSTHLGHLHSCISLDTWGHGVKSLEAEYKQTKIKSAVKLYGNEDPTIGLGRAFEEQAAVKGHRKEAGKFAEELGVSLNLSYPNPKLYDEEGKEVPKEKIKDKLKQRVRGQYAEKIRGERWQGKLLTSRWDDEDLSRQECFAWMTTWQRAPTHMIAGMTELYEQMLPTKVYSCHKTGTTPANDTTCRLCGKGTESMAHVIAGCSALAQSKYLERHNAALKVLYFELLRDLKLVDEVPPWYSKIQPKPLYESQDVQAFWDIPVYAEHNEVRANRVDARIVNHRERTVSTIEMSCPWVENRGKKDEEKTLKYGPLRWELKAQYKGYKINQYNVIIDVLGGWSVDMERSLRVLLGSRCREILRLMQRSVISSTLHIARTFKVAT